MTIGGPDAWYSGDTAPLNEWVECRFRGNDELKFIAMKERMDHREYWRERKNLRVMRLDESPDLWRPLQIKG